MPHSILFVIDAYNLIYRMFYAIPEMTTRSGQYINAIFGVAKFLRQLAQENPNASMIVTTDVWQSFRSTLFTEYKAQRDRMPDNLRSQIDGVFALFDVAGIQVVSREGYEADDIIGSITHRYENNGRQVIVISSDKDLCQFVRDGHVHIYDAMKRKFMKESDVLEKFWVPVHQVRDYLAIVGDASDNIPGINGFGPKKAQDLLQKFDTLEGIYDHIDELPEKMKLTLLEQRENAFLSQKLATIITDLHIGDLPDSSFAPGIETESYIALLTQYEFRSLIPEGHLAPHKEIPKIDTIQIDTIEKLSSLQEKIETDSWKRSAIISTDISGKIVIGYADDIYTVDSRAVDCSIFVTYLLESDIELVGYDLKTGINRLVAIQKPLQNRIPEEQGRLF